MEIKTIMRMKNLKKTAFVFLLVIFSLGLTAQGSYTFTAVGGSWTANATPTTIHAAGTDDALSAAINIGFNFSFGCTSYSQIKVSSNGWLTFDMSTSWADTWNDLDGTTPKLKVAPLWDDLAVGTGSTVNYKLTGTAPNRVLTVEWSQMEWTYSASAWAIGFQCKLYETSNRIEFIYNRSGGGAGADLSGSQSASIGLALATSFYSLDGVGAAPNASTTVETDNLAAKPATGQIYRWDPVQCSGTPTGGSATATSLNVCGNSTTLSLTGSSSGCGLTYQWQSSPNNSTWTNITGATSATYTATPGTSTYYRCVITCTASGASANSASVLINYGNPLNDNCNTATPLTVNTSTTCTIVTSGSVNCATASPQSQTDCWGTEDDDVWFSFVATAGSQTISLLNVAGSTTDMEHSVWTGNCPGGLSLVSGTCSDPDSQTAAGLVVGQTYYVRVYTYTSTPNQNSTFQICIGNPCPTCSGTPAGGSATASLTTVCGQSTTLSTTGSVTGCGYTYQWQSSVDNVTWTNIAGANGETYVASPNADIYYRRISLCPSSGNSGTSSSVFIDVTPGPINDDPCFASALTVGTSCTFNTYSTQCATNSVTTVGAPSPSCAYYQGGDVWFSVTVPSGGSLNFDSNTGVITDMGMAIYSGTCGSLTQIACDDDGSANGAMSFIAATGLTPGSTIWIRCWEYGNDSPGTFQLCVYDPCPPCSGSPSAGTPVATPASTSCGSPNTTLTLSGGSSGCGFTYQWQSSPNNSTWTNIAGATSASLTTPVTTNTYFRCIISCIASGNSSTSTSVLVTSTIANTCSFSITTPAYSPDAAYTAGTLLTFPDDQMSSVLPLGFTFCFMGTNYTQCVVSSNSFISFNLGSAGGYSSWVTVPIPTATPTETLNSIMFPWQDIDPSVGASSDIRYLTTGTAPNRKFIVNFSTVPMFSSSCNAMLYTGQVVLNETTNIIETYIQNKVVCTSWNGGNAVHGINGPDGCSGVTVAGRNNTQWTATNDAKQFTPTGCCNTALAAELVVFDGEQLSTNVNRIYWTTETETNLDKFIVERSEDGINFSDLHELKAVGNSSVQNHYSIIDANPFERVTYYRLRQIDFDGSIKYSNAIAIVNSNWTGFAVLNLFPNPSDGLVNAEVYSSGEQNFVVQIRDISGRFIRNEKHVLNNSTNIISFDISDLEDGIYLFDFINPESNQVTTLKHIKGN